MEQVLLIAGNSIGFFEKTFLLFEFLKDHVDLSGNMRLLRSAYMNGEDFWRELKDFLEQEGEVPLLLVYHGHGKEDGWQLNDTFKISYEALADKLSRSPSPIFLINDCCYAASIICFLENKGVSDEKVGLIAACENNNFSYGELLEEILEQWQEGYIYEPDEYSETNNISWKEKFFSWFSFLSEENDEDNVIVQRWGAEFDEYFLPSK